MFNFTESFNNNSFPAILLNPVKYTRCEIEGEIEVPADTKILVDIENSIALVGQDHVHIDAHEYKVLYS
jgi:hypothetical protein